MGKNSNYHHADVALLRAENLQNTYHSLQRSNTIGRAIGKMATKIFETFVSLFDR